MGKIGNMSQQIKELFTSISPTYDKLNHLLSFNIDKSWRKKTIDQISFDSGSPLQCLDLCAGTLDLSIALLKKYSKADVWAVDFSQSMLDLGIKKVPPADRPRLHTVCSDALSLPFPDEKFDLIVCGYGFRNLDDPYHGMAEMKRVLKAGGQLLILDFFKPTRLPSKLFHYTYGQFVLPAVGRLLSGKKGAYRYLQRSITHFTTLDDCKKIFEKQGFNSINMMDFFMGISSVVTGFKA